MEDQREMYLEEDCQRAIFDVSQQGYERETPDKVSLLCSRKLMFGFNPHFKQEKMGGDVIVLRPNGSCGF